jgi:DNA repair exonuclease SbcCD ATPase subunit
MSTLTKVSPYRQGVVRFGNRPHGIDTTVRTYQLTPEQLERLRAGEKLEDILREAKDMEQVQKPKVIAYSKYEEVVAERDELKKQLEELKANAAPVEDGDEQIAWLRREVIDAHKLVTEKEEEIAHWKELFETAMADKEQLQKENLFLENQVQRLKEAISELTERNDRYFSDLSRLEQEVKGLRLYALQKLHIDVYGA